MRSECISCGAVVNGGGVLYIVLKGYQAGSKFTAETPEGYLCSGCREHVEDFGGAAEILEELEELLPDSEEEDEGGQDLKTRIEKVLERLEELEESRRPSEFPFEIRV